jgi:uncharacterized protein
MRFGLQMRSEYPTNKVVIKSERDVHVFGIDLNAALPFFAIGFVAQLIDGALGMAFGVISNTALLWLGVPPALATRNVHIIKMFTGGASGISHMMHKNVDWKLFTRLSITGVIGGVIGAYIMSWLHLKDAKFALPYVYGYLTLIGIYILWRGIGHTIKEQHARIVEPYGFVGGFLDATGGGGWGPVVTSNLLAQGHNPRMTVGTVNAAEFILAIAVSITYWSKLGFGDVPVQVIGLLVGGVIAAPLASRITHLIPARVMMIAVGVLLICISIFGVLKALKFI